MQWSGIQTKDGEAGSQINGLDQRTAKRIMMTRRVSRRMPIANHWARDESIWRRRAARRIALSNRDSVRVISSLNSSRRATWSPSSPPMRWDICFSRVMLEPSWSKWASCSRSSAACSANNPGASVPGCSLRHFKFSVKPLLPPVVGCAEPLFKEKSSKWLRCWTH